MPEHLFVEKPCLDCDGTVTFTGPGDATCPPCGLRMFLNEADQVGRDPAQDWKPGGIQGRRPKSG